MNKLIFRKLSLDILAFFLLSSIAFSLIIWVIQGVNLLDIVTEKGHAISVYFIYSLLNIPKIFSKILIFTYFLTLFVVLTRYESNNEILVFWTVGIKKISFINFIAKLSFFFVLIQLSLNLLIVPYTQDLSQKYLRNSSMEFFPKLLEEKKFSNVRQNLTIFVDGYSENGDLKGIYIKEKINKTDNKIIIASKGKLLKEENGFKFKLIDGKITNIVNKGNFNIGFKETVYELSKLTSKTRQLNKIDEVESLFLISCLEKYIQSRKDDQKKCGTENQFKLKDIYQETFKRIVNPIYIIVLSLISSLIILKPKVDFMQNYYKFFLFTLGFVIILFSELSYKFITLAFYFELIFLILPLISIFIFYIYLILKTRFRISYL